MLGLLALAALAPASGCNGTGVTPMCDYPDGANNPEAGCGALVEASTPADALPVEDSAPPAVDAGDSGAGQGQDADATTSPPVDSGQDATKDAAMDAEKDAPEDVKDSSADHKG